MLILEKKNKDHEFCPFCGENTDVFCSINPYSGKTELELAFEESSDKVEKNIKNKLSELDSINEEDWLLP